MHASHWGAVGCVHALGVNANAAGVVSASSHGALA